MAGNKKSNSKEKSKFPEYDDGDTVIVTPGQNYRLHSDVLRQNSSKFADLLGDDRSAVLSSKAKKQGVKTRFKFALIYISNQQADLKQVQLNSMGESNGSFDILGVENGTIRPSIFMHWDSMLRAIYHQPLDFNNKTLSSVLGDTMDLLNLAEKWKAKDAICTRVDIALLECGKILWRSIAKSPQHWANLGARTRSKMIVKEAVIHLVGEWQAIGPMEKKDLKPEIYELCEIKHADLVKVKKAIDIRLLGWYPQNMHKNPHDNPERVAYANDIMSWLALIVYRHWYAQMVASDRTWRAEDGGFSLYKMILEAGEESYLTRDMMYGFHTYFPMSAKARGVLWRRICYLKGEMKSFVQDLLVNNTQAELSKGEWFTHLVCTQVTDDEVDFVRLLNTNDGDDDEDDEDGEDDEDSEDNEESGIQSAASGPTPTGPITESVATDSSGVESTPESPTAEELLTIEELIGTRAPTTKSSVSGEDVSDPLGTNTTNIPQPAEATVAGPAALQTITNVDNSGQTSRKRAYDAVRDCTEQNENQRKR